MTIHTAILGFAHGHVNSYCGKWREHPEYGVSVLYGWDHDANRLAKAAQDFSLQAFSDIDKLLALPDLQAVIIAAETSLHTDLVEKAAAAGKSIVLQKPMALTMPEADRIVAAVQRASVPFSMAWQMRVDPQNLQIKDLIAKR